MATDDRDTPAGAAEGTRADMPAGAPATQAEHGNPGADSGSPGRAAAAAGEQADDRQDDDFEPFLPPGPNPFSSVHPQGPPPYRPAANGGYPGVSGEPDAAASSRPADPGPADPGPADPGPAHPGAGPVPGHDEPGQAAVSGSGSGANGLGAGGQPPDVPEPGQAGYAEHGYPPVSPYPPVPDDEPESARPARGSYGGVSPYPVYRPYGPGEDDGAGEDALTDYGLPSPQAYGFAPPPPPVEPLPDLGTPGQGYRNEPYEPPGYREDAPGQEERGPAAASAPGRGRPGGGHRRNEGMAGQHRAVAAENGLRSTGLRGPDPADASPASPPPASPPPLGTPPGRTVPGRGYPPPGAAPSGAMGPLGPVSPGPPGPAGPPGPGQPGRPHPASAQRGAPDGMMPDRDDDGEDYPPLAAADAEGMQEHETADSLTAEALLQGRRPAPGAGWRRTIFKATGGLVRVGESASSQRRRELIWRARTPVAGGHHRVAVMSLKGGVGKTTTTVGLGATLATLRGDRIIAVDANPDRGTLSDKVRLETSATVRDLLNERQQVHRYADVRAFTSQASSRLEVLASDRDPAVSVAFSEADYCDVARVLEHYYSICITDCGTGLLHSAMTGVLTLADQIVLVSSPSVDGARSASATLDWLDAHDYGDLVRNAVVVLSTVRPRSKSTVDLDRLEQHFAARCRAVVRIPYDGHLEEGAEVELEQLSPATTEAYLRLAATVGDGFAWPRRALQRPAPVHP